MTRALICAAVVSLALGACGHVTRVGASRTLELGLSEYRLTPGHAEAHAGALSILAHNYGRLTHNLVLSSGRQALATSKPIAPGASVWVFLELAPGSYVMASNLFDDQALGLYGTLTVTR
jgi:hypothetical protein